MCCFVYLHLEQEVTQFAKWQAINQSHEERAREQSRKRRVQHYKGICYLYFAHCHISIYVIFSAFSLFTVRCNSIYRI